MIARAENPWAGGADPLDGIDLIIFDKDGTLIEFEAMWGDWVAKLAEDLEDAAKLPLADVLFALLGVDRQTGRADAHGLLAATPMSRIHDALEAALIDRGLGRSTAAAALQAAWHPPDPVALAHPVTDLPALLGRLTRDGRLLAIATADDREPTERTLAALGIDRFFSLSACADDGRPVKPAPDSVLELCSVLNVSAARTALIGDAPADLRSGRAAGVGRVIGVLTGVGDRPMLEPLADLVLDSIADLAPA